MFRSPARHDLRACSLALLLAAFLAAPVRAQGTPSVPTAERSIAQATRPNESPAKTTTRLLVRLRTEGPSTVKGHPAPARVAAAQQALTHRLAARGLAPVRTYAHTPLLVVEADESTQQWLEADPQVLAVQEDVPVPPALDRTVELVGAEVAWDEGYSGAGTVVAIIDSGVDRTHPFLSGKVVAEACFSTDTVYSDSVCPGGGESATGVGAAAPCSYNGCDHGTMVAGIAAGQGSSFSGVAPDASIIAVQVFSVFTDPSLCNGNAPCILSWTSDQVAALDYVSQQGGATAINMSLGGGNFASQAACEAANSVMLSATASAGGPVIAASGNNGHTDRLISPACLSTTVAVGATTLNDQIASFTNNADYLDVLAPGSGIETSVPGGGFAQGSGTSMAAPHVAGAFAVLKSAGLGSPLDLLTEHGVAILDPRNDVVKPRIDMAGALGLSLPVELTRFEAVQTGSDILLNWETATETNNAGFEVQMQAAGGAAEETSAWTVVDFIPGQGTTTRAQVYRHRVPDPMPGQYRLRLRQVDFDGAFEVHPAVEIAVSAPGGHFLSEAYPNPFNPTAQIRFTVNETQPIRISVHDLLGREVAILHDGLLPAGPAHAFTVQGETWPSGLYFVRAQGRGFQAIRRLTLLK
ncbi:MAG: S8 family serine peptidase [Bacteroidota bacterium]